MKGKMTTLVLTAENIQTIIEELGIDAVMDQLIAKLYDALANFSAENTIIPIRSGFSYTKPSEGLIEWMPLRDKAGQEVTFKMVGYHPNNPTEKKLPTILSNITKYDTTTGHLISVMDGVLPTALRTGAASAVASKLFAKSDSKILGLIGCGAQSITQLHALSRVFDLEKVMYFDTEYQAVQSFENRASILSYSGSFEQASISEIVEGCDILCTATSIGIGEGPLFENILPKDHLHINAVGSDFEGKIELPKELLVKSYVCPDFLGQAVIEGECQQLSEDQIGKDLFYCINNAREINKYQDSTTVFDSTGISLEDQVVGSLFSHYAQELGIGSHLQIENNHLEQKNPYSFLTKLHFQKS